MNILFHCKIILLLSEWICKYFIKFARSICRNLEQYYNCSKNGSKSQMH